MKLKSIELKDFRNLEQQKVDFNSDTILVLGKNGQGKTSLIEAIYLLGQPRSFRESRNRNLVSWDSNEETSFVTAVINTPEGEKNISYKISQGKREAFINKERVSKANNFYGQVAIVEFTPDDLQIVKGGPSSRRKLLDKVLAILDPIYVESLVQYQRARKQRNALLLENKKNQIPDLLEQLQVWNKVLIEHGIEVTKKRNQLINNLIVGFNYHYQKIINDSEKEKVSLSYTGDFLSKSETEILEEFRRIEQRDVSSARTNIGIQNDDIEIMLDVGSGFRDARSSASQGQSKSLALSLKLSATEFIFKSRREPPIVLLDDVESELDSSRREALFSLLLELETQIFITATELDVGLKNHLNDVEILQVFAGSINPKNTAQNSK